MMLIGHLVESLLSRHDFDEAAAELVEAICAADMTVEAHRLELGEHEDLADAAIDAIGKRDVDQPVFSRKRHGRLGAVRGERLQARAATAAEDNCNDVSGEGGQGGFLKSGELNFGSSIPEVSVG
jgi:hypothetical protein